MGDSVDSVKQLLRSVLLSSKNGVKANRLQGDYQELCGSFIPHTKFGFSSLHDFIATLSDVVRIGRNKDNELTYYAIADDSTKHIEALVSKQKSKKAPKKKAPPSKSRSQFSYKPSSFKPTCKPNWQTHPKIKKYAPKIVKKNSSFKGPSKNEYIITPASHNVDDGPTQINPKSFPGQNFKGNYKKPSSKNYQNSCDDKRSFVGNRKLAPRFTKKLFSKAVSEIALYQNPLHSTENLVNERKRPFLKSEEQVGPNLDGDSIIKTTSLPDLNGENQMPGAGDDQEDTSFEDEISESVISNLKQLLSIYECGLHLSGISYLYKETFGEKLPMAVLDYIASGKTTGVATIEKVNVSENYKCIIFPFKEARNKMQDDQVAMYVKPHSFLSVGKPYEVIVTYTESCEKIFVQLVSEKKLMEEMNLLIKDTFPNLPISTSLNTDSYVITEDGFRARVLSVNKKSIELYRIDLEDSTASYWTHIDQVRPLSSEIAKFSEFCVRCRMYRPSGTVASSWTTESAEEFANSYANAPLVLTTIAASSINMEHSVIFYKVSQSCECNINVRLVKEENYLQDESLDLADPFEHQPTKYASLPCSELCDLFVFKVSCTTEVEVCVIGEGYSDKLVELEARMYETYSKSQKKVQLRFPPPCNCVYAVVAEDSCTRGRLLSIVNETEGMVYLVDNGTTETIALSNLQPLNEEFVDFPMQSVIVSLAGLDYEPISTHCTILEKLTEAVLFQTCTAHVIRRVKLSSNKEHCIVELLNNSDMSTYTINQNCFEMFLNENLLPTLPSIGDSCAVSVSHADVENNLVFVRIAGEGMVKLQACLSRMESSLNRFHIPSAQRLETIYHWKLCLAVLENGLFRARVDSIDSKDQNTVTVYLIDVGECATCWCDKLLKLDDEELLSIPPQAVCCELSNETENTNHQFLKDVASTLATLPVVMRVEQFSNSDDPDIVSLWINDHPKVQVVGFPASPPTASSLPKVFPNQLSGDVDPAKCDVSGDASLVSDGAQIVKVDIKAASQDARYAAECMYAMTKLEQYNNVLKLEENPLLVKVENVVSPDFLQFILMKNLPCRDMVTAYLSKFYQCNALNMAADNVKINELYAFNLNTGNLNRWCRVRVMSILDDEASVYFVDYGDYLVTKKACLCKLHTSFVDIEEFCITAGLAGIVPCKGDQTVWPFDVSKRLHSVVMGKPCYAHVVKIPDVNPIMNRPIWEVCLSDATTPDLWINDVMVEKWECALFVSKPFA